MTATRLRWPALPMAASTLACLMTCAACSAPAPVPTLPSMPAQLHPRPVADCQPRTYREAIACGLRWRTGWREAEADKAAARHIFTPME